MQGGHKMGISGKQESGNFTYLKMSGNYKKKIKLIRIIIIIFLSKVFLIIIYVTPLNMVLEAEENLLIGGSINKLCHIRYVIPCLCTLLCFSNCFYLSPH